ncbi:MAG: ribosome maturation factor RimM [Oscillospiraceae bacterium]
MRKQYLECGKIVAPHGIVGEVKVQPWCDSPQELAALSCLYLDGGELPLHIERARVHKDMLLLKIEGLSTVEQGSALRGKILYLDRSDLPLEQGEYFIQDILGLTVVDADDGHCYGTVSDVTETGANDVYHITFPDQSVRLIPVIPQVVIETDIEAGLLKIRPLKGLFDDDEN